MGMLFRDQPQCLQVWEWELGSLRDLNPHIRNWAKHAVSRACTRSLLNLLSWEIVLSDLFFKTNKQTKPFFSFSFYH